MATKKTYKIEFPRVDGIDIRSPLILRLEKDIQKFARQLKKKGMSFTLIRVQYYKTDWRFHLKIDVYDKRIHRIDVERMIVIRPRAKFLEHTHCEILQVKYQGKEIVRDILRISENFVDFYKIKRINVRASLSMGGYVWLRYGYLPHDLLLLDSLVETGVPLSNELEIKWFKMTNKQKKEFVFTDAFREYKQSFCHSCWEGYADLRDPKIKRRALGYKLYKMGYSKSETQQRRSTTMNLETTAKAPHGNIGKVRSKETREKISRAHKGKVVSQATRDKISKSNKGKVFSKEHRENLAKARTGMVMPKETREKIAKALRLRQQKLEAESKESTTNTP